MCDIFDDYGFRFLDNVANPPVGLFAVGMQTRGGKDYYWDNSVRKPCFLFQYTLSGSGVLKIKEKEYIVKKGNAFFLKIPDQSVYYFDENSGAEPWSFLYIMFSGDAVNAYYDYVTNRWGKIINFSEYHPAIRKLTEIHTKAKAGLISNAFLADRLGFEFLCALCENQFSQLHPGSQLIEDAKEYIELNFNQIISLAEVAKHLGVSQNHLSREFIKHTGEQPIKYLTKIRLEKSVELLCSTDLTVQSISDSCGFQNNNYFCKVFKKYMKITPSEFRKHLKDQGYTNIQV